MKSLIASVCGILVSLVVCAAEPRFGDLLGEQVAMLEKVQNLSVASDYAKIYDMLGSDYRSVVKKEQFESASMSPSWKLTKLDFGKVSIFSRAAYVPVRATVVSGTKEFRIDTVVFFVKEESRWRFQNFPFLSPRLPDFASIPKWLDER